MNYGGVELARGPSMKQRTVLPTELQALLRREVLFSSYPGEAPEFWQALVEGWKLFGPHGNSLSESLAISQAVVQGSISHSALLSGPPTLTLRNQLYP